ncbi:MAG: M56 family metallopeptidase [Saccharofermentanales bacterium]
MTMLFLKILTMSIVASYNAVMVIFIRLILRKAPKVLSFALWSAVLFRLVCPFSFESRISLIPSTIKTTPQLVPYTKDTFINLSTIIGDSLLGDIGQSVIPEVPATDKAVGLLDIAAALWIFGMIILLAYSIISYVRCRNRISTATLLRNNIYETDRIHTPFVFGFFRPRIYVLPNIADSELYYILLHEKAHISRLDHLVRPLSFLVLSVYWFNPLIWISYYMMSKDMEMACDEKVMRQVEESGRSIYSQLLLTFSAKQSGLLTPLAFGESNLKGRILNILRYKAPALRVTGMACILLVLIMIGLGSNPKSATDALAKLGGDSVASQIPASMELNQTSNAATEMVGAKTSEEALQMFIEAMINMDFSGLSVKYVRNIKFIEKAFGQGCWSDVDFISVDHPAIETREAYILTATGEEISRQESERIYYEFSDKICRKYSYDGSQLSLQGAALSKLTSDEMTAYLTISFEMNSTSPVRMVAVPACPYIHYQLKFSGKDASETEGICNVEVDFIQVNDIWVFHSILYSAVDVFEDDV